MMIVALVAVASARASRTRASVTASMAAVESSKIMIPGPGATPRAMDMRWRWPPESATPRSPTRVS